MTAILSRRYSPLLKMGLTCTCLVIGVAATVPSSYPLVKTLLAPAARSHKIGSCVLDEDVFLHTDNDYANLRVINGGGTEVPSLIRARKNKKTITSFYDIPMQKVSVEMLQENGLSLIMKAIRPGHKPSRLLFQTDQRNYEKQVSVFGSRDQKTWTLLTGKQPIFDYARFIDLANTTVQFAPANYLFFKINVSNISESERSPLTHLIKDSRNGKVFSEVERSSFSRKDFRMDKVIFREEREQTILSRPVTKTYALADFRTEEEPSAKKTHGYGLSARSPVTEFVFDIEDSNFSRSICIFGSNTEKEKKDWQRVITRTIHRVDLGVFRREHLVIRLSVPARFRFYHFLVHNLDSPPLAFKGVSTRGPEYEALFFSKPNESYRILYGAQGAVVPRYDIQEVLHQAQTAETDRYELSPEEAHGAYMKEQKLDHKGRNRMLLIGAILLMVLTLVWLMAVSLRKVDATTPSD